MLTPWLEIESVRERLERLSEATEVDVLTHGTTSDADTIRDTGIAQPLLVATALATAPEALGDAAPGVIAGHSVGEFAAAALAGVLTDIQAMELVSVRAQAMAQAAAASEPTSMAAVLGGDPDEVLDTLATYALTPANMNGGGQVVAAGAKQGIDALIVNPPAKARVIELQVAGAFHTDYMAPAVATLAAAASGVIPQDPAVPLLSNADGATVASGAAAVAALVNQVSNPVRWDLCQETLLAMGVTGILEVAPGGVLAGLAKRTLKGIPTVALKTPDDVDAARALVEEHA